ncbi:hypothetical protein ACJ2A9_00535 [Anaerobacillus sp. MEB173]
MWKTVISYIPEWVFFIQAIITFFIPYIISKFFNWIGTIEEE